MEVVIKELRPTDILHRFSLPTPSLQYVDFAGGHAADLIVNDSSGELREIRCNTRHEGHPKPELGAGWRRYVTDYELRVGDRLVLLAEEDHIVRIVARRRIILLGVSVWGDLPRVNY